MNATSAVGRHELKFPLRAVSDAQPQLSRLHQVRAHPERQVNSLYFDSPDLARYEESEEGIAPRSKVRWRWYGHGSSIDLRGALEIKTTHSHHRTKRATRSDFETLAALLRHVAETCGRDLQPVLLVSYRRAYYHGPNRIRCTVDWDITYRRLGRSGRLEVLGHRDPCAVLEIKASSAFDSGRLAALIELDLSRFSKYCRGVDAVMP